MLIIKDRVKFYSLLLNIVLAIVVVLLLKQCHCPPCEGEVITIKTDTIRPKDTTPKVISVGIPTPVKSVPKKVFVKKRSGTLAQSGTTLFHSEGLAEVGSAGNAVASVTSSPCDTINIYSDTIHKPDTCTFIVNDTVEGRILGRSILYANLQPLVVTTITKRLPERWKVYVGGSFILPNNLMNWGIAAGGMLSAPKIGAVRYEYDFRNQGHQIGVYYLIRINRALKR